MSLVFWCAAVPVLLVIIRKCREYSWGTFKETKSFQNKVFIVTGANSGLGKETVKELVRRKARVIMGCRDLTKAENVIREIRSSVTTGELIPMKLDLSSFDSIRKFAAEVLKFFPEIHVLINNAGVSVPYNEKTVDGFEMNFGVNHLGHFLLTNLLLDRLVESAPSRIVIVSSSLHNSGKIDFNNFKGEIEYAEKTKKRNPAYNNSKLANVYFCRELASRLQDKNVETFVVCPGFCYTNLFRYTDIKWFHYVIFAPIAFIFMRSAHQGCQTILYCALSEEVNGQSGQIFRNCQQYVSSHAFDSEIQKRLWAESEKLVAQE